MATASCRRIGGVGRAVGLGGWACHRIGFWAVFCLSDFKGRKRQNPMATGHGNTNKSSSC